MSTSFENSVLATSINKLYLSDDTTKVSDKLAVRQFDINFQSTTALLLKETEHDFLIALPANISKSVGKYEVAMNASTFARRVFKSNISSVTLPSSQEVYIYLKTIEEVTGTFPDFFVEERCKTLKTLVGILEAELDIKPVRNPAPVRARPSTQESYQEGPPLPKFAGRPNLLEYIEEELEAGVSAISNGKIMPPPGSLPKVRH